MHTTSKPRSPADQYHKLRHTLVNQAPREFNADKQKYHNIHLM